MKPTAVVFDLFGTLLDVTSLRAAAARYTDDAAAFVTTWREKQLAYAFAAAIMDRYEDFDALTVRALEYAAARHGTNAGDPSWRQLAHEWRRLEAYADAGPALEALRAAGIARGVLTNGTPPTARAALKAASLDGAVDVVLSVDAARTYKPNARVYGLATAHFRAPAQRIVFVTSNGWDATGAAEFGFRVVWCNRTQSPSETFGAPPARTIAGLGDLRAAITDLSELSEVPNTVDVTPLAAAQAARPRQIPAQPSC